jgi:transposase
VQVADAYGHVVTATVALLDALNARLAALEEEFERALARHPYALVLLSQPGLGVVLAARVLGEFGDDPGALRHRHGQGLRGTAPVTSASGTKTIVAARVARNDRLANAWTQWAFAALNTSPGARRCYDRHRAAGNSHAQALRARANRLVGILHGCLASHTAYSEQIVWQVTEPAAA